MNDLMQRLEQVFEDNNGEPLLYERLISHFDKSEIMLVNAALAELLQRNIVTVTYNRNNRDLTHATFQRTGKAFFKKHSNYSYTVVLTVPETLRKSMGGFLSTKKCFSQLLEETKREVLVLEPFIDAVFIQTFEDEFRSLACRGANLKIITRQVGTDLSNLKAILRLYEIYALNCNNNGGLELFEYWTPLHLPPDNLRHFIGLHAKIVIADLGKAYVGSANWTEQSLSRNLETGLLTDDKALLQSYKKTFDITLSASRKLQLDKIYEKSTNYPSNEPRP